MLIYYLIISLLIGGIQLANRKNVVCRLLEGVFITVQVALTAYLIAHQGETLDTFFCADPLAVLLTTTLTIVATACFSHSRRYIEEAEAQQDSLVRAQYYGALTILTMALTMATLSTHMAMTWIFIEITTLAASALIFYRRNSGSIEATWKYVFGCSISLVLVYVGILLTTISMGEHAEEGLAYATLQEHLQDLDPFWLKMAFTFVLVGYTAKMGLVPMFTAGIDAKDKAPAPAAAMLSTVVMNAGFVGFYRFYVILQQTSVAVWTQNVCLATGLLSVLVSAVYLIRVHNIKRLLAYSSVEHIGVIMIGVATGGVGLYAAVLHLVIHSLAKTTLFLHVGQLYRVYQTKDLDSMGRYMRASGLGASVLILAALSITAMPPSGLFVTELTIFKSMIDAKMWVTLVATLVLLTVIVYAISRDIFALLFLGTQNKTTVTPSTSAHFPPVEAAWQILLLLLSIVLGLWTPEWVRDLLSQVAGTL